MSDKFKIFVFCIYSWLTNVLWEIMELMPAFIRNIYFKVLFQQFGKGSMFDYGAYARYPSRIIIGEGTTINRDCRLFTSFFHKDVKIMIGNHVAVAPNVSFFAAGHDYSYYNLPDTASSITVGDYVWICGNSIIVGGVTIGEGAVVAAGSVVVRDVEPYTIVGGNPAKFIKDRELNEARRDENS